MLVENFRAGTMERMGCGYETPKAINPRLVMVSISGYGQDGSYSQLTGYELIDSAMVDLMGMTGDPDGPPIMVETYIND